MGTSPPLIWGRGGGLGLDFREGGRPLPQMGACVGLLPPPHALPLPPAHHSHGNGDKLMEGHPLWYPPRQPGPSAGHPPASLSITTSGWDGTGRGGGPGGIPARITVLSTELSGGADRASGGQRAQNLIYGSFLFMPWGQPRASTPHFPRFHPKAARSALQQPPNGAEIVSPMPTDTLKP